MTILRVEEVIYGVEDLDAAARFHENWGLIPLERGQNGADFALPSGQCVRLRRADEASLPSSSESGSTLRETIWGVEDEAALDELGARLGANQALTRDRAGVLHTRDPHGFAIGFRVASQKPLIARPMPTRRNNPFSPEPAKPQRIGHVVYFVTNARQVEGSKFYMEDLGFRLSDRAMDLGDFLRAPGANDHHNLGLFWFRNRAHFAHVAYEVGTFDDVMIGGTAMQKRGWTPANKPGRHIIGSNIFWNFQNPAGGNSEYFYDMDVMDDDWQPRIWEKFPGLAHWALE